MSDEPNARSDSTATCVLCGQLARLVVEDLGPVCTSCLPRALHQLDRGVPFSD